MERGEHIAVVLRQQSKREQSGENPKKWKRMFMGDADRVRTACGSELSDNILWNSTAREEKEDKGEQRVGVSKVGGIFVHKREVSRFAEKSTFIVCEANMQES